MRSFVPPFLLAVVAVLCIADLHAASASSAHRLARATSKHRSQLRAHVESREPYNPNRLFDMFNCVSVIDRFQPDARLAAVYELARAMIDGTSTYLEAVEKAVDKVRGVEFETEKMPKTVLRLVDGLVRAAVYSNFRKEQLATPALLSALRSGTILSDIPTAGEAIDHVVNFLNNSSNEPRMSCALVDTVLLAQKNRLLENNAINAQVRTAITSAMYGATVFASTALSISSAALLATPATAALPVALGLASGITSASGSLTNMVTEHSIRANDAVKMFRRALRLTMIDNIRLLLTIDGKIYAQDDCAVRMANILSILKISMVQDRFELKASPGATRQPVMSRADLKEHLDLCAASSSGSTSKNFESYLWVSELMSHYALPYKYAAVAPPTAVEFNQKAAIDGLARVAVEGGKAGIQAAKNK